MQYKTVKSSLSLLLAAAILAGCLAGCGANHTSSAGETERPSRTRSAETESSQKETSASTEKTDTTKAAPSETAAPETTAAPYSSDNAEVKALIAEAKHYFSDLDDIDQAEALLLEAAAAGSPLAMYYYFTMIAPNKGLDGKEELELFEKCQDLALKAAYPLAEAGDPEGCLVVGLLMQYSDTYRDLVVGDLETAAAAGYTEGMIGLGDIYQKEADSKKAEEWYLKAYEAGDDNGGRKLASLYMSYQQYQKAIDMYQKLMTDKYRPWYSLGDCYLLLMEYDKAAEAYQQGIEEGQIVCSYGLGTVYFAKGESRKALECYAAYLEGRTTNVSVDYNERHIRESIQFMLEKNTATAEEVDEIMGEGFAASLNEK